VIASWKEQESWGSVFRLQQDCRKYGSDVTPI